MQIKPLQIQIKQKIRWRTRKENFPATSMILKVDIFIFGGRLQILFQVELSKFHDENPNNYPRNIIINHLKQLTRKLSIEFSRMYSHAQYQLDIWEDIRLMW